MIPHPTLHWHEILAAYADGEFEGRDDLAILKQRVEQWLAEHPAAQAELAEIRQLKQVWQNTTPPGPAPQAWLPMLAALECTPPARPALRASWLRRAAVASALAASIALAVALWWSNRPVPPPLPAPFVAVPAAEDDLPFAVAAADEVEILNVEGADTHTLVVGALPLDGLLVLAAPGEVTVNSVQPAARDNMLPEIHLRGPGRPMIWARLDTDE